MVYYQRPQSPHRDEDPYYNHNSNNNNNNHNNNNTYRSAPVDRDRDRDRDRDYHRSRRSSYSPARGRSPPRDAPKAPRAYHGPSSSSYRSRSDSHDRMSGRGGGNSGGGGGGGGGGGYYDRDAPRDRSRSREDREWLGGPASRDVIIEGLGADVDEDYIMRGLQDGLQVENVEKVTIIRDRKTGNSRQFAFVHFYSVPDARAFLQQYYPNKLNLGPGADRCKVAFSKERDNEDGGRRGRRRDDGEEEWKCRVCLLLNFPRRQECFRCQTPRSEVTLTGTLTHPTPTHFTNDGERDMATSPPSQFLLFRGLEPSVTEELLAKGALKLTVPPGTTPEPPSSRGPIGAKESSIKRVLLVRDRKTDESWRYGFVEFATALDAQAALAAYNKTEKFTISSRPVTASYIHPGVFVPVYNASRGVERFTFLPMTANVGGGLRLAYWDDDGYVSEFIVSRPEQEPAAATTADEAAADSKKAAKGTKDTADDKAKTKKRKADKDAAATGTAAPGISAASTSKKATPAHLQFWQNRHSELHGITKPDTTTTAAAVTTAESTTGSTSGDDDKPSSTGGSAPKKRRTAAGPADEPPRESFADMNKLACLLCSRVFKTPEKVHEHERVSTLHASNLKDPSLREAALKKLAKAGITAAATTSAATPEYRDRAKERRQVFGKSSAPAAAKKEPPPPQAAAQAQAQAEVEVVAQSKGAALLGKMGWTSGQGLGASGEGRTEHVVAEMYTQGAGLGMKGARVGDVEEVARGGGGGGGSYSEFVKKTKERALERYKGMD